MGARGHRPCWDFAFTSGRSPNWHQADWKAWLTSELRLYQQEPGTKRPSLEERVDTGISWSCC